MQSSNLLSFHSTIISEIHDPATSDLLIISRGLGLRRIICSLLKIYYSPESLIVLVGAVSPDEDSAIASELSTIGVRNPGLHIVDYEMQRKERQELYRKGGIVSVTSRILVVDLLQGDLPANLIAGLLVLHAERVTPSSTETFIIRLYREGNQDGFLKAFSDQPEYFTTGMFPLQTIMKELHLRNVHIYPRFRELVQEDLERRKADTVELYQPLSPTMMDIHISIVECMNGTLSELKRSNTSLDLDDLNIDNAYFGSFDALVRRQLDPVWHKVGVKTKQLVADLTQLRKLLSYLLSYDPVTFLSYVETVRESNTISHSGNKKQPTMLSPWLMTDAANVIFTQARRRVYIQHKVPRNEPMSREDAELEEAWNVLDEIEGRTPALSSLTPNDYKEADEWKEWMPSGMKPVLEDLPKWKVLSDILDEIEQTMVYHPSSTLAPGSDIILIMANDHQTCGQLREFLSTKHLYPATPGRHFLELRLLGYFHWKKNLRADSGARATTTSTNRPLMPNTGHSDNRLSEGMKKKDAAKAFSRTNRRRIRGGPPSGSVPNRSNSAGESTVIDVDAEDLDALDSLQLIDPSPDLGFPLPPESYSHVKKENLELTQPTPTTPTQSHTSGPETYISNGFEQSDYGLLPPDFSGIIRPYGDDSDDMMLTELRPRWIIMYEPNLDFIRRVEVYRSLSPGLALRLYHMVHSGTSEEHRYLIGIRKEKDSFKRLIDERAKMVLAFDTTPTSVTMNTTDRLINVISSRNAGGQKALTSEPPRILVDVREFRSSLPNMLHKARYNTTPLTLTVGDYILTPDIVIERKSLSDLVQSLQNGRLYNQCELMSVHYRQPVLLIEFEENKSFSMQSIAETPTGAARRSGSGPKAGKAANESTSTLARIDPTSIQSKLVLLTLHFPRLRIIWSSSPPATVGIFADLKAGMGEPDPERAVTIGTDAIDADGEGREGSAGVSLENTAAQELLRTLPGVGTKNYRHVMTRVGSIRELCGLQQVEIEGLLGTEPGRNLYDFLHRGLKGR